MRSSISSSLYLLIVISLLLTACRSSKDLTAEKPKRQNPEFLQAQLQSQYIDFEWFSGRAKVQYQDEEKSQNFTANIRMRRDSIVWVSITSLMGVEAARILITTDTIHILQKVGDKKYYKEPFTFVEQYVPFPFSMRVLQDIIIGNVAVDTTARTRSKLDKNRHVLITENREVESTFWMHGQSYTMEAVELFDKDQKRKAGLTFTGHEDDEVGNFSFKREVIFTGEKNISANIKYTRTKWNKPMSFPFSVSDRYEEQF